VDLVDLVRAMKRLRELLLDGILLALPLGAAAFLLQKVIGLLARLLIPVAQLLPEGRWLGIAAVEGG
jgi:flagellar biosynthesis protein FliR